MGSFYDCADIKLEVDDVTEYSDDDKQNIVVSEHFTDELEIHNRRNFVVKTEEIEISANRSNDNVTEQETSLEFVPSNFLVKQFDEDYDCADIKVEIEDVTEYSEERHKDDKHSIIVSEKFTDEVMIYNRNDLEIKNEEIKISTNKSSLNDNVTDQKTTFESIHSNIKKYKCNMCDYATSWKDYMKIHVDCMHSNVKEHIKTKHSNVMKKKYYCSICDHSTTKKCALKVHMEAVHLKIKKFQCAMCDYSSSHKNVLKIHINSIHLNVKEYKCDMCDYASARKDRVKLHKEAVHLRTTSQKCDLCDYSSIRNCRMREHVDAVHLKIKKHKCDMCDFSAYYRKGLKMHIKYIHSNIMK